jgi:hypothetical protein
MYETANAALGSINAARKPVASSPVDHLFNAVEQLEKVEGRLTSLAHRLVGGFPPSLTTATGAQPARAGDLGQVRDLAEVIETRVASLHQALGAIEAQL